MDYTKTTPFCRYSLDVEAARADLKAHGFDFALVEEIQQKIHSSISEYGDIPELALAFIVSGYNAKCMANQDSEFVYSKDAIKNHEAYKHALLFQVVKALAERHEDELYEVISSWRV